MLIKKERPNLDFTPFSTALFVNFYILKTSTRLNAIYYIFNSFFNISIS